ncbi:hypothetical protein PAECIP111802_07026 [Paenibacillus allorhizosphaerae]|uniref:Uncharacterized protein n=2 Tax=Paenibacillus allorhizosphaerae TaxID=2849866 RepID=A0ABM8VU53_9BACL|nr:hypothetical protein PAECIP111802_07026 [Paenibacillus allorhizosphaerae]
MNAEAEPYTFQVALDKFMNYFYDECTVSLNEQADDQVEWELQRTYFIS